MGHGIDIPKEFHPQGESRIFKAEGFLRKTVEEKERKTSAFGGGGIKSIMECHENGVWKVGQLLIGNLEGE